LQEKVGVQPDILGYKAVLMKKATSLLQWDEDEIVRGASPSLPFQWKEASLFPQSLDKQR